MDGVDTPVWNLNVGDGAATGYFAFVLLQYSTRHPEQIEKFAGAVANIGELAATVEQARARGWNAWPSLPLASAAKVADEVLKPVDVAIR